MDSYYDDDDDLADVYDLDEMDLARVDGVGSPASGFSFLVMKSRQQPSPTDESMRRALKDPATNRAIRQQLAKIQATLDWEARRVAKEDRLKAQFHDAVLKALNNPGPKGPTRR